MNNKPKLLLVADTYFPKVDGTLRFMQEFMKRAPDQFDISLLVPDLGSRKLPAKIKHATFFKTYKKIQLSGYPSIRFNLRNIARIKKAIRAADIVFVQGPALASYLALYYSHKYKKTTIFYTHVITWELLHEFLPPLVKKLFFTFIKRFSIALYNKCNRILVAYNELEHQLKHSGVHSKMSVARLGVDIERFSPSADRHLAKKKVKIDSQKTVIGYVGRISKEKQVSILRKAFMRLRDQEKLHLLIVGDGDKEEVRAFKKLPNCTVTGFVKDVYNYTKAMDVFVMPSLTETTSLATLEAMSSGAAVIATRLGFMKTYITRDHNGLFFPKNSPAVLAAKLDKLVNDRELREKLGKNARKTIAYSFSWERSINRIKRLLMETYYEQRRE